MSDTTTDATVKPTEPRFAKLKVKVRRLKRSPYTVIAAAAAGAGTAAYLGTNKALRDSIADSATDAVEAITDMLETPES